MMFLAWKMLLDVTRAVKHRVMGIFWCVTNTQITGAGWIPPTPDVSYLAPMAGFAMEGYIMIYTYINIYNVNRSWLPLGPARPLCSVQRCPAALTGVGWAQTTHI